MDKCGGTARTEDRAAEMREGVSRGRKEGRGNWSGVEKTKGRDVQGV
jgi:hypothetical protein